MRWVVIFKDKPEMNEIRANKAKRDAHVSYVRAHPELLIGGGLKPGPDDAFCGALWVVEAPARIEVERLIENDPFYVPHLRSYQIYTWGKILEDQTATL
ncbi:YciI family protein [Aliiroseovarius marinus]|uniref:YciI family protein n=1 Tax=Aliiroseovarius marinus TaxID=2500159 RepID=UPI003D7C55DB